MPKRANNSKKKARKQATPSEIDKAQKDNVETAAGVGAAPKPELTADEIEAAENVQKRSISPEAARRWRRG